MERAGEMKEGLYHLDENKYRRELFTQWEEGLEEERERENRIAGAISSNEGVFEISLPVTIRIPRSAVFFGDEHSIEKYIQHYVRTVLHTQILKVIIEQHPKFVELREKHQNNAWQLRHLFWYRKDEDKSKKLNEEEVEYALRLIEENEQIFQQVFQETQVDELNRKKLAELSDVAP